MKIVQLQLPDAVFERIDEIAKAQYNSRNSAIISLLNKALETENKGRVIE